MHNNTYLMAKTTVSLFLQKAKESGLYGCCGVAYFHQRQASCLFLSIEADCF